jgi:hypothetical protein
VAVIERQLREALNNRMRVQRLTNCRCILP